MSEERLNKLEPNERSFLRKAIQIKKQREKKQEKSLTDREKKEQVKKWTTFYRRNLDVYAEYRLKISLKSFQHLMLYLMGISQIFFGICSRGLSKTFTVGLFCVEKCLLWPNCKVVITASSIEQAAKMVREKIDMELCGKISPVLKWMKEEGLIKINISKDKVEVKFPFNGSIIRVLPPEETSRGSRANVLVYEECRLLKKKDIDSIFTPMMEPRRAAYCDLPYYQDKPEYLEEGISIYITSARHKIEWFWTVFKKCVIHSYTDSRIQYSVFAGDIYTALKYGLKTRKDWIKVQSEVNELDLRMEYLNEMIGAVADAYFTHEVFINAQTLGKAFSPPTALQVNSGQLPKNRQKQSDEVRILVIDFAMSNSVKGGDHTDFTVIECISGVYRKGYITGSLEYLETIGGGESEFTNRRIHELFWDYQADYIVLDQRSGGEVYYNNLTKPYIHPERSKDIWNPAGFSVVRDYSYHFLKEGKIDDLIHRTVDTNSINCVIPVIGTSEFNSRMWQNLLLHLKNGRWHLLMDDMEHQQKIETSKAYLQAESHERMQMMLPYVQTSLLVNEGINLKQKWTEGKLKLLQPRYGTKDRMVALGYANEFFNLLENKFSKQEQQGEFCEEDWYGLIQM